MKRIIHVLFFVSIGFGGMSQNRVDSLYLEGSVGEELKYGSRSLETVKKLILYRDGVYSYEVFSLGVIHRFSAGSWAKLNDSTYQLMADKKVFKKIFSRGARQRSFNRYEFIQQSKFIVRCFQVCSAIAIVGVK